MAADPNQKLFLQIADLGRNISSLAESIKKNTSATESLVAATDKSEKREKEAATAANKAPTANPKEAAKDSGAMKDITKTLSDLLGDKSPLMGKFAEMAKTKISPALGADKQPNEPNKDFSNIAGGLKGIIKAFQEGGVAKKEGKYLVGENGPEVVKLPKGAGVIPINVKDLMEGLKTVPELADLIKDKDTIDFYGSAFNPRVIGDKGATVNLGDLSSSYEKKMDLADRAKDDATAAEMSNKQDIVDALSDLGVNGIHDESGKLEKQTQDILGKQKKIKDEDYYKRNQLIDDILAESGKDGNYYNNLAAAQAELLATQTVFEKKKTADEELAELPDSLVKEGEASLKKESEDLKKSSEIINPKEGKKEKKGLFSKLKKEKGAKEKSAEEKGAEEKGAEEKDAKKETKGSNLLAKIGGGAENALFSAADKATESLGAASPFAKKGLSALKGAIDKKGGLKESLSKKEETKTDLGKKSTEDIETPKSMGTPALVSDVKKLAPLAKKDAPKENESPKEEKTQEAKSAPAPAPGTTPGTAPAKSTDSKSASDKKSETTGSGTAGLGSDKDIQDIKNALVRVAGLLEGTLSVSVLDQPFRPDSRRI